MAAAYVAVIASAAAYGGRTHGTLGTLAGLAAGVGVPMALFGLLSYIRRRQPLVNLGVGLVPFLVVGVYLLWPDVLLLRLAAVATALAVTDVLFQSAYAWMTGGLGRDGFFDVHAGHFLLVVVVGTVLAIWWGWVATGTVLLVDGTLIGVSGLANRKKLESRPPEDA